MKAFVISLSNLVRAAAIEDRGGEVIEYALIVGLVIVAAIATVTAFGTKVLARWTSVDNSI